MNRHVFWRRAGILSMTLARFLLGLGMLPYATSKLERLQFELPAWTYAQPLGEVKGTGLLWATMGYSPRLQMFLGLLELVPAILLLVRRTRRVGALLMLPVAANVWVLNMGLDLWPVTKLISTVFLLLNLFLIAYDLPSYRRFFAELLAPPTPLDHGRFRQVGQAAAWLVPIVCVSLFLGTVERQIHMFHDNMRPFIGARQINRAGTWRVVRFVIDGRSVPLPPEESLLYFDFGSRVVTGTPEHPVKAKYATDAKEKIVRISDLQIAGSASPIEATYADQGDTLRLAGMRDGKPLELTLRQEGWGVH